MSPPGGLLAEQAYRRRMNRILSHCSLMLHYSVLACLFASVNFSFNVSGSFQDVDFLWMTRRDVTFPFARLCDANSDWLQGIFFFFSFSVFFCINLLNVKSVLASVNKDIESNIISLLFNSLTFFVCVCSTRKR